MLSADYRSAVAAAVRQFGVETKTKLAGPGEPEDALRAPVERLFAMVGAALGLEIVLYGEMRLSESGVRPDYAVAVDGAIVGYVELKAPGKGADPSLWSTASHDRRQWERLQSLPNLIYSDGQSWGLYRSGDSATIIARLEPDLKVAGDSLESRDAYFAEMLALFLYWNPRPPRSIRDLVRSVAGLCRLLREEVLGRIWRERAGEQPEHFTHLAVDWRRLLFPKATDAEFADQYAQTVTFALLLARVEGISFEGRDIGQIARLLGKEHSLMGKALEVLTDESLGRLSQTTETLVRVVSVVDWAALGDGSPDVYLHLYEEFLQLYDPELRKETGTYYTPNAIVRFMVRFCDDLLRERLGQEGGFASPEVVTVDPAVGTGTYLLNVIDRVAQTVEEDEGREAVPARVTELAHRLIGFELQTGPFAVAELRAYEAINRHRAEAPEEGLKLLVSDTLGDPKEDQSWLPMEWQVIARSRREVNRVKREEPVMVVIGNPPYRERAKGMGGWVESGNAQVGEKPLLGAFRAPGKSGLEYVLSNLYIYFWRWATWKVFNAHESAPNGIVAFITTSGYISGPGFAGMREYLRRNCDEGWIIDLTPEGHQPPVATRPFPGVQQPLCIGIFARYGARCADDPAPVHYLAVQGLRDQKFQRLESVTLDDAEWRDCVPQWQERFLPEPGEDWARYPKLGDLMPWQAPGVKPNRTWVYAPDRNTLRRRWRRLVNAPEADKAALFKETDSSNLRKCPAPLPGYPNPGRPFGQETGVCPEPVSVAYRAFDRQWIIPDSRLHHRPSPPLWQVAGPAQLYVTEQHAHHFTDGPGITFTAEIPDMDHTNGRGGRVLPLYRDASGTMPNLAPGLLRLIDERLILSGESSRTAEDMLAYIAAVTAHPAYTARFAEDLKSPGIRVPLTADPRLWQEAVDVGREALWLHTYGQRFVDPRSDRPRTTPRLPDGRRPRVIVGIPTSVQGMPDAISYVPSRETLHVGAGKIAPVPHEVWEYQVAGMKVVAKWFGYRKRKPAGRRSSLLDDINPETWPSHYTSELLRLLNVIGRCVDIQPRQTELLERICAGPQITVSDLVDAGAIPAPKSVRGPIAPLSPAQEGPNGQGTLI
ncbi:hypothetical protein GCM10009577_13500 [Streptomyces javensis]